MSKWVYDFAEGSKDMRELLGGKGANVAEMTRVLGPDRVPSGFTITTEACVEYMRADQAEPDGMADQVAEALDAAGGAAPASGSATTTTRCWCRSAPAPASRCRACSTRSSTSGSTTIRSRAWRTATDNDRFAWDSYRRFVQMFGNVSRGIPGERFEDAIKAAKSQRGVSDDTELDVDALRELTATFKEIYEDATGEPFPQDPTEQLRLSIRAVFDSWVGDRAVEYRRINRIPDDWGTAVNVQQMVFGNKGDTSGSGVAFSRDEVTGAPEPSGDFLAQRPGRGRRLRRSHPAGHRRGRGLAARRPRAADGDPAHARAPLPRHAGHRVHGRRGQAVHAADAQRQAAGAGGGAVRGRRGRGGPADA